MEALRAKHTNTLTAFDYGYFGLPPEDSHNGRSYLTTYTFDNKQEKRAIIDNIEEGLQLFSELFGYEAILFTPPNAVFDPFLEKRLSPSSLEFITRGKFRFVDRGNGNRIPLIGISGRKGLSGIRHSIRTCAFEHYKMSESYLMDSCLARINQAFLNNGPAIISSHRVNFVGSIEPKNREVGLRLMKQLLERILAKWPEVEFMSSADLYNLVMTKKNGS